MSGVYHTMSAHGKLSHIVICQYCEYWYESWTRTASDRHCGPFTMRKLRLRAFIWLRWSGQGRAPWLAVVGLAPKHQWYSDSSLSEVGKLGISWWWGTCCGNTEHWNKQCCFYLTLSELSASPLRLWLACSAPLSRVPTQKALLRPSYQRPSSSPIPRRGL